MNFYSNLIPYGGFLDEGLLRHRGGGTIVAFEAHGSTAEATSAAELESHAKRLADSIRHLGTGDGLHVIFHRVPVLDYPARSFPSEAARRIDDERRRQFLDAKYYCTPARFYIWNQDESALTSFFKATFFPATAHRASERQELQRKRFLHRVQNWTDAVETVIHPRRMGSAPMFRDLVL